MPYVERDEVGAVKGVYARMQEGYAEEWLSDDDPEAVSYLNPPPKLGDFENAIQALVDDTAASKLFRDGVTLASYAASTNPLWAAQALAFVAWRDQVWACAYVELAKALSGEREIPTVKDFLIELPAIVWPE